MKTSRKLFSAIAITAIIAAAGIAGAHDRYGDGPMGYGMMGRGYGNSMGYGMMGRGYGNHMGYGDDGGYGLTDEQAEWLGQSRESFFNATRELRQTLSAKQLDLREALNAETPDLARLKDLQQEVSTLRAELELKRLEHRLEVQKMIPATDRGPRGRAYAGFGRGCWD